MRPDAVKDWSMQREVIQAVPNYKINDIAVWSSDITMMHFEANLEAVFQQSVVTNQGFVRE